VERLGIGDINYDGVCIERKAVADYIASICDGRLFAQAEEMTKFPRRYMIIVGELSSYSGKVKPTQYLGALASIMTRYGIGIAFVQNNDEYLYLVLKILQKSSDGKDLHRTYLKKEAEVPSLLACVSSLPGIGNERAEKIVAKFASARALCDVSSADLQEIDGVGPILSEVIKSVFH
jgi:ERCC4-type nuclease